MEKKEKMPKTYPIGHLFLVFIIFIIVISVLTFIGNIKSNDIIIKISELDKKIKTLEKEIKVLSAEEAELSSPNRFIETAILNGFSSTKNNDDIMYIKIEEN